MTTAVPCCDATPAKPRRLCGFNVVRGWPLALGAVAMMVAPFALCAAVVCVASALACQLCCAPLRVSVF